MVFDLCEPLNLVPSTENFYNAIREWLDSGNTPTADTLGLLIRVYNEKEIK